MMLLGFFAALLALVVWFLTKLAVNRLLTNYAAETVSAVFSTAAALAFSFPVLPLTVRLLIVGLLAAFSETIRVLRSRSCRCRRECDRCGSEGDGEDDDDDRESKGGTQASSSKSRAKKPNKKRFAEHAEDALHRHVLDSVVS